MELRTWAISRNKLFWSPSDVCIYMLYKVRGGVYDLPPRGGGGGGAPGRLAPSRRNDDYHTL